MVTHRRHLSFLFSFLFLPLFWSPRPVPPHDARPKLSSILFFLFVFLSFAKLNRCWTWACTMSLAVCQSFLWPWLLVCFASGASVAPCWSPGESEPIACISVCNQKERATTKNGRPYTRPLLAGHCLLALGKPQQTRAKKTLRLFFFLCCWGWMTRT
ncbi:hypothetical protein TW95_gp0605 [Pandoravirus inopinatum]|uniref:Uncharacterized protein n=1 Tax=Pandoravirus inopinatum TaxID=1605721 RepID=A0A0B5J1G5_9VIRU|nr:hypothetical protein TW95_gp0605 [Pandoravirus inopinatum]AJF97339.1 hypothetical protein [Pandoravirus inopinatum]